MPRSILVCGGTGLVGSASLAHLLSDPAFDRVVALTRRPLPPMLWGLAGAWKLEERVVDFDRLGERRELFGVDQVLCALGTTMKKAGSRERFRTVDLEYPLAVARLAAEADARHFLLVSAVGADPSSRVFYNRVKGELETALQELAFPALTIVRPSLLRGSRPERRLGEEVGKLISFLLPRRYRAVSADAVARTLVAAARADRPGVRILESDEIRADVA